MRMPELLSPENELVITRKFKAPRDLVFRIWTEPTHMKRWICPKDFIVLDVEVNLTVGGKWRSGMRAPTGADYYMRGVYQEIKRPERLVFTHSWEADTQPGHIPGHETHITITLDELNGITTMIFHVANLESIEGREGQRMGWSEAFDHFEEELATLTDK